MKSVYKLAIVGRPNDGKSSIFANFLGDDEVAISPLPGETKQMQPHLINLGSCAVEIIDTPGLQHPETVFLNFERYRSRGKPCAKTFMEEFTDSKYAHDIEIMKAVSGADVCMIVVNADNFFGHTQKRILDTFLMLESSVALVGVINRSDETFLGEWREQFERRGIECFGYDAFKSRFRDFSKLFDEICSSATFRRRSELGGVLQMLKQNRAALFDGNFDAVANEILNSLKDLACLRSSLRMSGFSLTLEEREKLRRELSKSMEALARKTSAEVLRMIRFTGIKLGEINFGVSEADLSVKSPGILSRVWGCAPFVKRPLAQCAANPASDLPLRFLRAQAGFVMEAASFSYAQSATKAFGINSAKSAMLPVDESEILKFFKRALKGDDSDSFYKLQSALRDSISAALKKF